MYKKHFLLFSLAFLTACGFKPIYGTGPNSVLINEMRYIKVMPIENRIGQQLLNHLEQMIAPEGSSQPKKYLLKVVLQESKQTLALKKSKISTRANIRFSASYNLIDKSENRPLADGNSHIVASYNILSQNYATLIAEKDARKRAVREIARDITIKLATFFQRERQSGSLP